MERDNLSAKAGQSAEQPKVLYIDGCKVTVRYSGQKNPVRGQAHQGHADFQRNHEEKLIFCIFC